MTKLSRRMFFGGIGAAVAIASTAGSPIAALASAAPAPVLPSALPPVGFLSNLEFPFHRLAVSYVGDTVSNPFERAASDGPLEGVASSIPRLNLLITKADESEAENFESVRALYEHVFPERTTVAVETAREQTFHIARQSNMIAALTRRGAGNTILHSPNSRWLPAIMEINWQARDSSEPVSFETDDDKAPYNTSAQPWLSDDEIIVFYDGGKTILDGPFRATVLEDGTVRALVHRQSASTLGRASDFGAWLVLA